MPQFEQNDPFKDLKDGINNAKDDTMEFDPNDIRENRGISSVAYISFLFWLPLVLRSDSKFARFHANQGLIFFIFTAICSIAEKVIDFIPIAGTVFSVAYGLASLFFFVYGLVNTLNGNAKELPFIGGFHFINYK